MTELKIGIVGLDTSHCKAFTEILNNSANAYHVPGGHVTCAFPGGTEKFSLSRDRVQGFTRDLKDQYGLQMVGTLRDLIDQVDAVLLESVDGRQHLEQFRQLAVGKPIYIDKPLATSSDEAKAICQIAAETKTPVMSCSSLRFASGITNLVSEGATVDSCEAFGPSPLLDDYPGLYWYGIHSAEVLFMYMGEGCVNARLLETPHMDVVVGEWQDGRVGVMRGTRLSERNFGCIVHTSDGVFTGTAQSDPPYYAVMLDKVMAFFKSGISPISLNETLEIIAFLEAADASRVTGGQSIHLRV
jgi:hypothetical protein